MNVTMPARPLQDRPEPAGPRRSALAAWAVPLAVAAGLLVLSVDQDVTQVTGRSVAAILALWAIVLAVAFGVWPRAPLPRATALTGGLLLAFAGWAGLSTLWAPSPERAFAEFGRLVLYAALFALPVLAAARGEAVRWADGMAAAVGVVALLAVGQRLLPGVFPEGDIPTLLPAAATRLSYPVGYWNALGILLGAGLPLLLRLAAGHAPVAVRALAVVPLPALGAAIYLTSSRGGFVVAGVSAIVFLAVTARRFAVLQALLVATIGALLAIAVLRGHPVLVDGPLDTATAGDEGPGVAAALALVCVLCGVAYAALAALAPPRLVLSRGVMAAIAALLAAGALAGLVAADPAERVRAFKQPPVSQVDPDGFVQKHLFSSAGSGRWQFWDAALEQFGERPLVGQGAGTYEAWWARHGSIDWFVRNAHSLWLETLGELGIAGLLLLAGGFAAGLVAGAGRLRGAPEEERTVIAALLAVVAAFAVGAAIDWVWQIPAVAALAVVSLGLLAGPATGRPRGAARAPAADANGHGGGPSGARRVSFGLRVALVLLAWAAIVAAAIPFLATSELRSSERAAARGDLREAEERAASARAIQPWAASPHLQLALIRERAGDLGAARRQADEAIERAPDDWRLRLVAARLATKAGDIPAARSALREARRLNPRSPILRSPPRA
jgi:O-antigen ligase/polysaccharide polymerase Wzy-like membrane protein